MLIVMRDHASSAEIDHVVERLHEAGAEAHLSKGEIKTIVGVIGDRETIYGLEMEGMPGVEEVVRVLKPYKLVSREFQDEDTVVGLGAATVGAGALGAIAGPCSVESSEQMMDVASSVSAAGATMLRGGRGGPSDAPSGR